MKKFFLFIVLLTLVNGNLFAATGCLKGGEVYTVSPGFLSGWTSPIQNSCGSGATPSTSYADVNSITNTSCSIGVFWTGGTGVLVNYDIEFCPIDDYIPLMLVMIVATSGFFLRRNFLKI